MMMEIIIYAQIQIDIERWWLATWHTQILNMYNVHTTQTTTLICSAEIDSERILVQIIKTFEINSNTLRENMYNFFFFCLYCYLLFAHLYLVDVLKSVCVCVCTRLCLTFSRWNVNVKCGDDRSILLIGFGVYTNLYLFEFNACLLPLCNISC